MKLPEKKQKMLTYIDYYGADIPDTKAIKSAKMDADLVDIITRHRHMLENQLIEALSHLEGLKRECEL